MRPFGVILALVSLVGCKKEPAAPPALDAAPPEPTSCEGLGETPCVKRAGCILDQPRAGAYVCRAARNACERAVRHGDVIGHDVAGVTDADHRVAVERCNATEGCTVAGGRCSCACHVFGQCDCECGGGWLERCTPKAEAAALEGFPRKASP